VFIVLSVRVVKRKCTCTSLICIGHSRDVGGKFYKSIYFNMDEYMGPIVLLCVGAFMILHITTRTISGLIWHGRIRWYEHTRVCPVTAPENTYANHVHA